MLFIRSFCDYHYDFFYHHHRVVDHDIDDEDDDFDDGEDDGGHHHLHHHHHHTSLCAGLTGSPPVTFGIPAKDANASDVCCCVTCDV